MCFRCGFERPALGRSRAPGARRFRRQSFGHLPFRAGCPRPGTQDRRAPAPMSTERANRVARTPFRRRRSAHRSNCRHGCARFRAVLSSFVTPDVCGRRPWNGRHMAGESVARQDGRWPGRANGGRGRRSSTGRRHALVCASVRCCNGSLAGNGLQIRHIVMCWSGFGEDLPRAPDYGARGQQDH